MSVHIPPKLLIPAWADFSRRLSNLIDGLGKHSEVEDLQLAAQDIHALTEELAQASGHMAHIDEVLREMVNYIDHGYGLNSEATEVRFTPPEAFLPLAEFPYVDITKLPDFVTDISEYNGKLVLVASENGGEEWVLSQITQTDYLDFLDGTYRESCGDERALRQILQTPAKEKLHVLLFSGIHSQNRHHGLAYIGIRLFCAISRIPFPRIAHCVLKDEDWSGLTFAVEQLSEKHITVETADSFSVAEIEFKTVRARRFSPGLIVIEQSQNVIGLDAKNYYIPMWMGALKCIARGRNVPVLLVQPATNEANFEMLAREADSVLRF